MKQNDNRVFQWQIHNQQPTDDFSVFPAEVTAKGVLLPESRKTPGGPRRKVPTEHHVVISCLQKILKHHEIDQKVLKDQMGQKVLYDRAVTLQAAAKTA